MPGVQTSNLGGSMNPSGGVATSLGSSMSGGVRYQEINLQLTQAEQESVTLGATSSYPVRMLKQRD